MGGSNWRGPLVGKILSKRRQHLDYTLTELSHYLAPTWCLASGSVAQELKGLEAGGAIQPDLSARLDVYIMRISTYAAALELPITEKTRIVTALKPIDQRFTLNNNTQVKPYGHFQHNYHKLHELGRKLNGLITDKKRLARLEQLLNE